MKIFKVLLYVIVFSIFFLWLVLTFSSHKRLRSFSQNHVEISEINKVVDSIFVEKIYILEHSEIQSIQTEKTGYINKDNNNIDSKFFNVYYVVFTTGDSLEVSLEKFEQIQKGDVIEVKTELIQK